MTIHKYEISLISVEERLGSPFESIIKNRKESVIRGDRKVETRQKSSLPAQKKKHNTGARESGIVTIITQEREHTKAI